MITLRDIMTPDPEEVEESGAVKEAVNLMWATGDRIGALPVTDDRGRHVALLTYHCLLEAGDEATIDKVVRGHADRTGLEGRVRDARENIIDAARFLLHARMVSHLLVKDEGGKIIGIVSHRDLIQGLLRSIDERIDEIRTSFLPEFIGDATPVTEIMTRSPVSVAETANVGVARQTMKHNDIGALPVKDESGRLVALVSYNSVLLVPPGALLRDILLPEWTGLRERTMADTESARDAAIKILNQRRVSHLLVVDTLGDVRGIVSHRDIISGLLRHERELHIRMKELSVDRTRAVLSATRRLEISESKITTRSLGAQVTFEVTLRHGEDEYSGTSSGVAGGTNVLKIAAEATADAVCDLLNSRKAGHAIAIIESLVHRYDFERGVVSIVIDLVTPDSSRLRHVGSAIVRDGDHERVAAAALLDSVNRQVEAILRKSAIARE